jgi:glycosyltransferase involved in cell wall biosynthesis
MTPKITVTLPVYNGMPFLKAAVDSVLEQSYRDFRFLVVDDGSTDGSKDYLKSIKDTRLRVICRENRGLGTTLNQLFSESDTEYVARMDSDDLCAPDRIECVISFLNNNRDVVMVGSDQAFLVGNNVLNAAPRPTEHDAISRKLLDKRPGVLHPTVVVRRDAWERVGGYRLSKAGEDLDFLLRICDIGRVANISKVLYYYRLHEQSLSYVKRDEINLGYGYGVACALARRRAEIEPDLDGYLQAWNQRSFRSRAAGRLSDLSQFLYRRALVHRLSGRPIRFAVAMVGAAALQPVTTTKHIFGM